MSPVAYIAICDCSASGRPATLLAELRTGRFTGTRLDPTRLTPVSRRPIARRLVAAAEAHLRARGAARVSALVARDDPAALALWAACHYRDEPSTGRFVKAL